MRKLCTSLLIAVILVLYTGPGCVLRQGNETPSNPPPEARQPVVVRLVIPNEVFDPEQPTTSVVRCIVWNNSKKPVEVPIGYHSGPITAPLHADGGAGELILFSRVGTASDHELLQPGKDRVVFEMPLGQILDAFEDGGWLWRGPGANALTTPIGIPGAHRSAFFWVELPIEGKPVTSNRVRLKVKGD